MTIILCFFLMVTDTINYLGVVITTIRFNLRCDHGMLSCVAEANSDLILKLIRLLYSPSLVEIGSPSSRWRL